MTTFTIIEVQKLLKSATREAFRSGVQHSAKAVRHNASIYASLSPAAAEALRLSADMLEASMPDAVEAPEKVCDDNPSGEGGAHDTGHQG